MGNKLVAMEEAALFGAFIPGKLYEIEADLGTEILVKSENGEKIISKDYFQTEDKVPKGFYELLYFYDRGNNGSVHLESPVERRFFLNDTNFLQYLTRQGLIDLDTAYHVYEIEEISEEDYKMFR